ncbi:MAG: NAD(+) synthase [Calditrichaeota bacterium]|nr:MAG: NAD(+) synthase [Calditrichota bacterium]
MKTTHELFQNFNPKSESEKITSAIKSFFDARPFLARKVIIGLSGGIDSAVSSTLFVKAIGSENVITIKMPSSTSSKESIEDADRVINFNKIPNKNVQTKELAEYEKVFEKLAEPSDLRRGNFCARMRMINLFDQATKFNAIVGGTENLSEHFLGYFTICGDQGSIFEPIEHLYKTEIRMLAEFLEIPNELISKAPTADLWQAQTDETELGFTYREADIILKTWTNLGKPNSVSVEGIKQEICDKVLARVKTSQFKREIPYRVN